MIYFRTTSSLADDDNRTELMDVNKTLIFLLIHLLGLSEFCRTNGISELSFAFFLLSRYTQLGKSKSTQNKYKEIFGQVTQQQNCHLVVECLEPSFPNLVTRGGGGFIRNKFEYL